MKSIELIKYITELSRVHQKRIFKLRELSTYAQAPSAATAMALLRLKKKKIVERIGSWWINLLNPPSLEEIGLTLRAPSYISFENALFKKTILSQSPRGQLSLVTTQRPVRYETSLGNVEYIHIQPKLFFGYDPSRIAYPEKALLDLIYIRIKKGWDPLPSVTIYWEELKKKRLKQWAKKFPPFVSKNIPTY